MTDPNTTVNNALKQLLQIIGSLKRIRNPGQYVKESVSNLEKGYRYLKSSTPQIVGPYSGQYPKN